MIENYFNIFCLPESVLANLIAPFEFAEKSVVTNSFILFRFN